MKRAQKNLRTIRKKLMLKWRQDSLYNSHWLTKFNNKLMKSGKKAFAQKKIRKCFQELKLIKSIYPKVLFFEMLELLKPTIEMIPRKISKNYRYIPTPVVYPRNYKLVLLSVNKEVKKQPDSKLEQRLFTQLVNLVENKKSSIFNDIEIVYQLAVKNKAFTSFAWTFYNKF